MQEPREKTEQGQENETPKRDLKDEIGKTPETRRRYFRMFEEFALNMKPVHEIAKEFGCSKQHVYLALQWVKDREPEIGHGVRLLASLKAKEDIVRKLRKERDAILDHLEARRAPDFNLKDYKGPSYNHYMLNAVMLSLKAEEDALFKLYGVAKDEIADALKKIGSSIEEAFPAIFSHLSGERPVKRDTPSHEDQLKPGITAGTLDTSAEDQGQPGEPTTIDGE